MTETRIERGATAVGWRPNWRPALRLLPFYRRAEFLRQALHAAKAELRTQRGDGKKLKREVVEKSRQVRALEKVVHELMDRHGWLPLPPPELRVHVGRVPATANFLAQGLDSARRVLEVFGADPGGPVLDWGCGSGRTLAWLKGVGTWDSNYRGCDVDAAAISWLQDQGVAGVDVCGDLPPLPHEGGTLAGLFCFSVLTHIPPKRHGAWYAEIHRVLKPGGRAYVTVHGDDNIRNGKSFTDEERRDYARTGWSWSERDGHYKHAATVSSAFTIDALAGRFEIEAYRELGYHSMDALTLRRT